MTNGAKILKKEKQNKRKFYYKNVALL